MKRRDPTVPERKGGGAPQAIYSARERAGGSQPLLERAASGAGEDGAREKYVANLTRARAGPIPHKATLDPRLPRLPARLRGPAAPLGAPADIPPLYLRPNVHAA